MNQPLHTAAKTAGEAINFIGIDGSGKDTAYNELIKEFPEALENREPGGTPEAEQIREVLLSLDLSEQDRMDVIANLLNGAAITEKTKSYLQLAELEMKQHGLNAMAEVYLYAASRAETNEQIILPALQKGTLVLGRRSVACSMSYQGKARGLGMEKVWHINQPAIAGAYPTLEILFDLPASEAAKRIAARTDKQDRLDQETLEFHEKTREGYLEYYRQYCPYPYVIIDASVSKEEVLETVRTLIHQHFKNKAAL